jgi:hypothetical protein
MTKMKKKEKQELQEIKKLLVKILEKLDNLKVEKTENYYYIPNTGWGNRNPWYKIIPGSETSIWSSCYVDYTATTNKFFYLPYKTIIEN